jgi:predicted alpha/beta-fold hydrolase
MDHGYPGPRPLTPALENAYACPPFTGTYDERIIDRQPQFTIRRITFPSTRRIIASGPITVDYYDVDARDKVPVIMVLPILGGKNKIARIFARYFAANGYAAVIVHRQKKYKDFDQMDKVDQVLRQMVLDHRQVLDWIETRQELDRDKTGVFGVSMGGIKAALVAALDPRIKASVLALAGGDLARILAFSTEKGIEKKRLKLMAQKGITPDEFYNILAATIQCDPLEYAPHIDARNTMMILALFDRVVPFENGRELKKRIGNPETIYLMSGHYSSILYIHHVRYQALRFFKKKIPLNPPGSD